MQVTRFFSQVLIYQVSTFSLRVADLVIAFVCYLFTLWLCYYFRGLVTDEVGDAVDLHSLEESLASNYASASFRMVSSDILVSAVLLPSLRAEYKVILVFFVVFFFFMHISLSFQLQHVNTEVDVVAGSLGTAWNIIQKTANN